MTNTKDDPKSRNEYTFFIRPKLIRTTSKQPNIFFKNFNISAFVKSYSGIFKTVLWSKTSIMSFLRRLLKAVNYFC